MYRQRWKYDGKPRLNTQTHYTSPRSMFNKHLEIRSITFQTLRQTRTAWSISKKIKKKNEKKVLCHIVVCEAPPRPLPWAPTLFTFNFANFSLYCIHSYTVSSVPKRFIRILRCNECLSKRTLLKKKSGCNVKQNDIEKL